MAKTLLLSLKGYAVPLTCHLCPSQRPHLGQLMDSYFLSLQLGPPLGVSEQADKMWTRCAGRARHSRRQGAACKWKRPRPGWCQLYLLGHQPSEHGDSYHLCPCDLKPLCLPSSAPWSLGLEQRAEAGVGNCVSLVDFDARRRPHKAERMLALTPYALPAPRCFHLLIRPHSES